MYYYEVYVGEPRYQKPEPLTYSHTDKLAPGQLVSIPYGNRTVSGFIHKAVKQPSFQTKQITEPSAFILPDQLCQLHAWLQDYYPSGGAASQLFTPNNLKPAAKPLILEDGKLQDLPPLTKQQTEVVKAINSSQKPAYLLHGETGSGKTRVYLELAYKTFNSGKSVLILTPEISLTPQLVENFSAAFNGRVVSMHSGLTQAVRRRHWQAIASAQQPVIVIGTRSALFAPIKNLGLVVIDEMHEPAYKQDSAPRYHGLRVGAALAKFHDAPIIYGSATPSVIDYYLAETKGVPILRLTDKAVAPAKVTSSVIDLKDRAQFSRDHYLSDPLLKAIGQRLAGGQQALLFLNRRGTARQILCQDCGWQALCPRCDLPLTYHGDAHQLRCHTCGHHEPPPLSCPSCSGSNIIYRSLGTKALVDIIQKLFPEARLARFDTDNLADESLARNFSKVKTGEIDILIGTQMLGKGLDLPRLSLVGIINADTGLHLPDFSSAERSYQLLHQAIGRVGRGHLSGEVIIQTFRPDDELLQAALAQNWQQLYKQEITERRNFSFPPFVFLLKLTASRKTSASAEAYIRKLRQAVIGQALPVTVEAPTPGFYERSHGKYNWQLVIKSKQRTTLINIMKNLPAGDYTADIDPLNLL